MNVILNEVKNLSVTTKGCFAPAQHDNQAFLALTYLSGIGILPRLRRSVKVRD